LHVSHSRPRDVRRDVTITDRAGVSMTSIAEMAGRLVSSPPLTGLLGSTDVDVWLVSTLPLDGRRPVPEATARHAFLIFRVIVFMSDSIFE